MFSAPKTKQRAGGSRLASGPPSIVLARARALRKAFARHSCCTVLAAAATLLRARESCATPCLSSCEGIEVGGEVVSVSA
jgi:hypothetical protein